MTTLIDETGGAGRKREALESLAADFTAAAAWIREHPGAEVPVQPTVQLQVPAGLTHEAKLVWLEEVAAGWGIAVRGDGMGGRLAEKRFGMLRLVAHVCHPDRSVSGFKSRAAAAGIRASQPEGPVAA